MAGHRVGMPPHKWPRHSLLAEPSKLVVFQRRQSLLKLMEVVIQACLLLHRVRCADSGRMVGYTDIIPTSCGPSPDVGGLWVLRPCRFQDLAGKKSGTVAGSTPGIRRLGRGGIGVRP